MFIINYVLFILVWTVLVVTATELNKYEGDFCTDSKNAVGRCTPFDLCAGVHSTIYNYDTRPILCGFKGNTPVVCCTSENLGLPPDKVVPKKVGDLALEHCNKYSLLTHLWVPSLLYNFNGTLIDMCRQTPQNNSDLPYPNPVPREYPYMIAFAVGPLENIDYVCSGALISDQYVLTTISCAKDPMRGFIKWAVAGDYNLYDDLDDAVPELSEVAYIFTNTQSSSDLAVVKLKHKFQLTRYVIPACLPTSNENVNKAFATGWHLTKYQGDMSKALLQIKSQSECQYLMQGRNSRSNEPKVCGKPAMKADYCQRTIGDPLVAHRPGIYCMYDVIGITSSPGEPCDDASIFADVKSNIAWIEQVVWGEGKPSNTLNQAIQNNIKMYNVADVSALQSFAGPDRSPINHHDNSFNTTGAFDSTINYNSTRWQNRRKPPPLIRPNHHTHTVQNNTSTMCPMASGGQIKSDCNFQSNSTDAASSFSSINDRRPQENSPEDSRPYAFEISDMNRIVSQPIGQRINVEPNMQQNIPKTVSITNGSINQIQKQILWHRTGNTYIQTGIRTIGSNEKNTQKSGRQNSGRQSVSIKDLIETQRIYNFGQHTWSNNDQTNRNRLIMPNN